MIQHMLHIDGRTYVYDKHVHVRVTMHPLTTTSPTIIHIIHDTQCPWQMPKRIQIARAKILCYYSNNNDNWCTLITKPYNFQLPTLISKIQRPKSKIKNDSYSETQPIYHPAKNRESPTPFVASRWVQRNFSQFQLYIDNQN